jgi:hypothetical protein
MKKLIWIGAAVVVLLGSRAAVACDETHQTAQQEKQKPKPQKKVAAKAAVKKAPARPALAQNEKR